MTTRCLVLLPLLLSFALPLAAAAAQAAKGKSAANGKAPATKTAENKAVTFQYDARYSIAEDTEGKTRVIVLSGIENLSSFIGVLEFADAPQDVKSQLASLVKEQAAEFQGVKLGPVQDVKLQHAKGVSQAFTWKDADLGECAITHWVLEHKGKISGVRHITFEGDAKEAAPLIQAVLDSIQAK